MPKKKIIYAPNLTYHTISRCIELKDYLKSDSFKFILEKVLKKALDKYEFELSSYVIMSNHIHFIIRTVENGPDIGRIVQYIKSRFAESFNRKMNRSGHFWNERYKCKIIEFTRNPEQCCYNMINYIGYNPVKSGQVKDPCDYRFSSFRAYVEKGYKCRVKITLHPLILKLGDSCEKRIEKFLQIEKQYRARIRSKTRFRGQTPVTRL